MNFIVKKPTAGKTEIRSFSGRGEQGRMRDKAKVIEIDGAARKRYWEKKCVIPMRPLSPDAA